MNQCFTCWPGAEGCTAVRDYQRLVVSEHGGVKGARKMKAEIYKRGPISCSIDATEELDAFVGDGIFVQHKPQPQLNHVVSVVGWGVEDGVDFWIVRNSWGASP